MTDATLPWDARDVHREAARGRRRAPITTSIRFTCSMNDGQAFARGRARLGGQPLLLPAQHPAEGCGDPFELPAARSAPDVACTASPITTARQSDEGGIEAWLRLGEACGLSREELLDGRHVVAGSALRGGCLCQFCAHAAVAGRGRVVAHGAFRAGS